MADDGTQYEVRSVKTVRGLEAKPTAKMQAEGWELVTQTPAPLLRTQLTFRRPNRKLPKYALPLAGGAFLILAIIITIGAITEGKTPQTATTPPPSAAATSQEPAAASATPVASSTPLASATSPESTLTANQVENFLKESYGIKTSEPWSSLCGVDKGFYPYPCAISQITLSSAVLRIRVQDAITEAKAETYAMYALNFLCATDDYTKKFAEVTWVEISDTSGGARGQQSAAVNRMCQVNR